MPNEDSIPSGETPKPKRKTRKGGSAVRRIGPFAPVALALLIHNAITPPPAGEVVEVAEFGVAVCEDVETIEDCHSRYPTGCTDKKPYDPYLNFLKNQLTPPPEAIQSVPFLTLADFEARDAQTPDEVSAKKGNHGQFRVQLGELGEGHVFGVVGYLYALKKTDKETSNCGFADSDSEGTNVDYHIWIGFDDGIAERLRSKKATDKDKASLKKNSVLVEMTPHYRAMYREDEWKISALRKQIGKQVRVVGQLLFDSEHNIPSQNCFKAKTAKQKQLCWRGSAWELHPVTQFLVCKKTTGLCATDSPDWVEVTPTEQ